MIIDEENKLINEPLLLIPSDEQAENEIKKEENNLNQIEKKTRGVFYKLFQGQTSGAVFCLLCLTFGSGIMALPYSLTKTGIILGILVFLIASFCVYWTTQLLVEVAFNEKIIDYSELIEKLYGRKHKITYDVINLLVNFGSIVVYQQIISNFFFSVLEYLGYTFMFEYPNTSRAIQMFCFCLFTQIPLTFSRNIEVLTQVSFYGTLSLLYTVFVSVIEFPFYFSENYSVDKIKLFDFNSNLSTVLCIYFFSYANHNAVLNVINEVQNKNSWTESEGKSRGLRIANIQYAVLFLTYLTVMLTGYLSTFDQTNEIFLDRKGESIFIVIGKSFYILSLTCHIGLYYYISRPSIEKLFIYRGLTSNENYIYGASLLLLLSLVAYKFKRISTVISIIGGTADIYLVFVMPILLYVASYKSNKKSYEGDSTWKRFISYTILIFGCCVSVSCVTLQILDIFYDVLENN